MTAPRALLVDLDGTLLDTAAANLRAYAAALAGFGVAVGPGGVADAARGRNWREFLPPLLARAGADPGLAPAVAARKADLYAGEVGRAAVNLALVRVIEACRPACRTALVTSASGRNAGAALRAHGLLPLFDAVVTGDDVARHKPDPEAYARAASRLGVAAADCVAVEDSDVGAASAAAFGAAVLRVAPFAPPTED